MRQLLLPSSGVVWFLLLGVWCVCERAEIGDRRSEDRRPRRFVCGAWWGENPGEFNLRGIGRSGLRGYNFARKVWFRGGDGDGDSIARGKNWGLTLEAKAPVCSEVALWRILLRGTVTGACDVASELWRYSHPYALKCAGGG